MNTFEENYCAVKKCALTDYPYSLSWDDDVLKPIFNEVYQNLLVEHARMNIPYYSNNDGGIVKLNYIDHYVILCYRYARALWINNLTEYADCVYYTLRVRGGIDLFYRVDMGPYFIPAHALGTCLDAHAIYGKGFRIYNGCHIGPYSIVGLEPSKWKHPSFGDWVTMLSGSRVYGSSRIGNNVIISVNTLIINEEIPDNCIVSGSSPDLYFQRLKTPNSSILKQ